MLFFGIIKGQRLTGNINASGDYDMLKFTQAYTGWLVGNGVDGAKASDRAWPQVV